MAGKGNVYLRLWHLALLSLGISFWAITDAWAAEYHVGPGQPLESPNDVPWDRLLPGDIVLIEWRSEPYRSKWVLCCQGTAHEPIVIRGVPNADGELPVIDGDNAVTPRQLNFWSESRGVIKVGGANVPEDREPAHIVIENLDIRSARPGRLFIGRDGLTEYDEAASAIFIEKGEHITIRNCLMHDCGNGFFTAADAREILVESCVLWDNGIEGSYYQHNAYTAAAGITYQFNSFGPLRAGCGGNNLKDRSAGTVIRYNWIAGGNRQLDLVDGEDSESLRNDPRYHDTYVYGNVFVEFDGNDNNQIVHYGGDSGDEATYRPGTLHFYHNTVVSFRSGSTTLLRLSTDAQSADVRANILYVSAPGNHFGILAESGTARLTGNWIKEDWRDSHDAEHGRVVVVGEQWTGASPGFADPDGGDYSLGPNSPCRDRGVDLEVADEYLPTFEFDAPRGWRARSEMGLRDLGAFERH